MRYIQGLFGSVALGVLLLAIALISVTQQTSANRPDYDNPSPRTSLPPEPGQSRAWEVVRVSDGDTLTVRSNGREQKVRFCGIDAPENAQPLGHEARVYLQQLVDQADGRVIVMETDRDRYGRLVAEVFTLTENYGEERSLQAELLAAGLAYIYPAYISDCPNGSVFKEAEAIAKEKQVGVWNGNYQRPWDYRKAIR
ncbi:thermonuclease family protein [Leptolyngbya sp. GB1-A1]|uniref:thermonuclease family protein n=1 Tax=Leptolyngbya sp. GB1-A1 TaxID=2933908 RepID=UPI00329855BC